MIKKKKIPAWINNKLLAALFQSKFGIVLSNWLAQCMLYAETVEVFFRLFFELSIFLIICFFYSMFFNTGFYTLFFIGIITHTISFFINGQFFVLGRFLGIVNNKLEPFIQYPEKIRERLKKRKSITCVVMFGSLSRKSFSPTSDLDVRVISEDGFINNFIACFWTFIERFIALINKYPLDIYVVTKYKGLEKLRSDEIPIILFDKKYFIEKQYEKKFDYDLYKKMFLKKYSDEV